ncbi:MAG: NAD(P)/FAD-dependent oxidoreductase [Candidatus Asgardarchaeia archaeon]
MSKPINILVVGAGDGGTIFSNSLVKHLKREIKRGEVNITLIDKNDFHYYQPANLYVAFKGHDYRKYMKPQKDLLRSSINFLVDEVIKLDPDNRFVETRQGKKLEYNYLVWATGSNPKPELIPGLDKVNLDYHSGPEKAMKIWETLNKIKEGTLVFGITDPTYKCPPSPLEGAFLTEEFFKKRKLRDKVKIIFVTPLPRAYSDENINSVVEPLMEKRNIELITFFNIDSIDPEKKVITSFEGNEIKFDHTFLVPPHQGSDVAKEAGIADDDGWIPVDKHYMCHEKYKEIFAIGDVAKLPTAKTGVTAHLEGVILAQNLANEIRGIPNSCAFLGRTNCPFELGYGKALFVQTTYSRPAKKVKPSRISYLMKKGFTKIFWSSLKGTWDWLFSLYFGSEEKKCERKKLEC